MLRLLKKIIRTILRKENIGNLNYRLSHKANRTKLKSISELP